MNWPGVGVSYGRFMDAFTTPCIFCGSDRPLASETCPSCGRGWIDERVAAGPAAPAEEPAAESALEPADTASAEDPDLDRQASPAEASSRAEAPAGEAAAIEATPPPPTDEPETGEPTEPSHPAPFRTDAGDTSTGWELDSTAIVAVGPLSELAPEAAGQASDESPPAQPAAGEEVPAVAEPSTEETEAAADGVDPDETSTFAAVGPDSAGPDILDDWEPFSGDMLAGDDIDDTAAGDDSPSGPPSIEIPEIVAAAGPYTAEPTGPAGDEPAEDGVDEVPGAVPPIGGPEVVDPRTASDEMLDDGAAWRAFAAGDLDEPDLDHPAEAAEPAAPTAPPAEPVALEPPTTGVAQPAAAGTFGGGDPDESGFFADEQPPRRTGASVRSQRLIVGLIVVGIVAAWFVVLGLITRDDGGEGTVAVPEGAAVDSTVADQATTTVADQTTTTSSETTTTSSTTTTTTATPLEPIGDPIAISELGLGGFALGPLDFGDGDALGRLVATFGEPDERGPADASLGLCEGDTGFFARWGPLTGIFLGAEDISVFEAYRLAADGDHPAAGLSTLSGFQVGGTVADLESTYSGFSIAYEEIDGALHFILQRTSDNATLLWGPVTSAESDGIVEGISSPRPCDAGPAPTG